MGTNYYFFTRDKEAVRNYFGESYNLIDFPDFGYSIHIAKTSVVWLPLFQAHERCRSVEGLFAAYQSGKFGIFDEYGDELTWESFTEEVLRHNGGVEGAIPKKTCKDNPDSPFYDSNMPDHVPVSHFEYGNGKHSDHFFKDPKGYEFSRTDFL